MGMLLVVALGRPKKFARSPPAPPSWLMLMLMLMLMLTSNTLSSS